MTLGCVECGTYEGNLTVDNFVLVCPTSIQSEIPLAPNSSAPPLSQYYPPQTTAVICNAYASNPTNLKQLGMVILERCAIAAALAAVKNAYKGPQSIAESMVCGCAKATLKAILEKGIPIAESTLESGAAIAESAVSNAANTAAGSVSGAASTATQGASNVANAASNSASNAASSAGQGASNVASSAVNGVSSIVKIPGQSLATRNSATLYGFCLVLAALAMLM